MFGHMFGNIVHQFFCQLIIIIGADLGGIEMHIALIDLESLDVILRYFRKDGLTAYINYFVKNPAKILITKKAQNQSRYIAAVPYPFYGRIL